MTDLLRARWRTTTRAIALLALVLASLAAQPPGPSTATVDDGDASCACPVTGPYVAPAGVRTIFVDDDGSSATSSPRYRVSATGSLPAITLTIRRTADDSLVDTIVTDLPSWGFSPDQDRFVVTGIRNGLHEVEVHDLTSANPSDVLVSVSTTEDAGRLGFSPHGEFFAYTGLVDGTNNTVHQQIWDARTGTRRLDTQYAFAVGPSGGTFGEAGFGFSPDDDEFFLAYRMDAQAVAWSVHDLDSGTQRSSGTMTGTGFWQFSPCGEMLAIVSQNNQTAMDVVLRATDDGSIAASTSYSVASISFARTATHHSAVVDGVPHDLVAVSPPVPDVCAPTWPADAVLEHEAPEADRVVLSWPAAADGTAVTAYRVYRGTTLVGSTDADTRQLAATGLAPWTTYTFRVEAGDAAGHWSEDGPTRQVTTAGAGPTWPSGATLTATDVAPTSLTLTWPAAQDGGSIQHYRIYRDGVQVAERAGSVRTHNVTGLARGTSYEFTVQAVDDDGIESTDGPRLTTATDAREPLDRNAITGRVFHDGNANGIVDGGDVGLPTPPSSDWTAMLSVFAYRIGPDGRILGEAGSATAADGSYALENLSPGTWLVGEANFDVLPYGMRLQTRPGDLQPHVVQVGAASGWAHVDFGMTLPTSLTGQPVPDFPDGAGSITQVVFEDVDRDGTRDPGEAGVAGVPTSCYRITTAGGGGCGRTQELPDRGVTGADGVAVLDHLGSGVYQAMPPQARAEGIYPTSPQTRYAVAAGVGGPSARPEFGVLVGRSAIVGEVFDDVDADGVRDPGEGTVPGVRPCVEGPLAYGCGEADGAGYRIPRLVDETYSFSIQPPEGTRVTTGGQQQVVVTVNGSTVQAAPIGLHDTRGTISGTVFEDADRDGVRDAGEPGMAGVEVCERSPGEEGARCTDTGPEGDYELMGVLPGDVEVTPGYFGPLVPTYDVRPGTERTREVELPEATEVTVDLGFGPAPGAPGAPRNVSLTPGPGSVDVTWEPPSDLGDDPDVTYQVRYAVDGATLSWLDGPSTSGLDATLSGLAGATAHWVVVEASSSAGVGPASAPVRVVTGATTSPPPSPSPSPTPTSTPTPTAPPTPPPTQAPDVAPSAPRAVTGASERRGVRLTWKAPSRTGSAPVTRYVVQLATARSGPWQVRGRTSRRFLVLTGLRPGRTYFVRVRAVSAAGDGPWSSRVRVRWR
ncbi:fibronectin type III domain-containing protein [Nocardioides sp.]|uniref:fibronectin type III domain-containing protein n=1 Tax=Nocardioides sp. TaxID=35761 RepID=UPI0035ADC073